MTKYRFALIPVILLILGILIWRTSMLFTGLSVLFTSVETGPELDTQATRHDEFISFIQPSPNTGSGTDNANAGHYETIEETIARLKRDVIVTGTITGIPGRESAMFQIEGMPDRLFNINTQLMDGFIIRAITDIEVELKNQQGDETFFLNVQHVTESLPESEQEAGFSNTPSSPDGYDPRQSPDGAAGTIYSPEDPDGTKQGKNIPGGAGYPDGSGPETGPSNTASDPAGYDPKTFPE